ncbi:TonB-dependent receptor [Thalassotalea marina]|uniref:TonB-dependent receptor n=1 Tax=Thalassotalea marina TaxID=1673741 RepID=A0A919BA20_9GAMM|nr:TonB-dependent receptor [Thalassotalea marina]GHF77861.1 TonB-dependent receptor [Thalassotalea marina]
MKHSLFKIKPVFTAVVGALITATTQANVVTPDAERQSMETITVLGEKANRSLKDTTSSVAVITEEELNGGQFLTFTDAIADIPNLVSVQGDAPNIRGVVGNGSASGFDTFGSGAKPRVSTIIDGVVEPFVAELSGDSAIWDIEQIEVFRGPQSTTNGRNSIGGLIFVKTKDPSFDWEGAARLGYRNQDSLIETSGVISGPIVEEELAFRLTAQQVKGDVFGDYIEKEYPFDPNELESRRIRAKLLWEPKNLDGFSALLSYSHNREQGNNGRATFDGPDPFKLERSLTRHVDTESDVLSLTLNYDISDTLSLSSTVADMSFSWNMLQYPMSWHVVMDEDSLTTDTKLNYTPKDSNFSGFIGVYYFEREQEFSNKPIYSGTEDSSSRAIYGEASFDVNDKLNIVVGGRYENERQDRPFSMPAYNIEYELNTDKNIFLPKIAVTYDITKHTTLGLSARKGYNAGGGSFNFGLGEHYYFDQEKVTTYELSSRSEFFGGDTQFSANIFFNDYDGYQDGGFGDSGKIDDYRIINVKQAQTYGAEMSISTMLTEDFELNWGLGLLKTEITDTDKFNPGFLDKELSNAPSVTSSISAKYWLLEQAYVNISASYVGEYFTDVKNTTKSGDYVLTRLAFGYEADTWQINAFVNNLFDTEEYTRLFMDRTDPTVIRNATILQPQTIGASITYHF